MFAGLARLKWLYLGNGRIGALEEGAFAGLVELEFLAVLAEENIQDQLAYLSNQTDATEQREVSLRLLRHFASAVRHRKYSGIDIERAQIGEASRRVVGFEVGVGVHR